MGFAVLGRRGQSEGRPRRVGVMTCTTRADRFGVVAHAVGLTAARLRVQGADVVVAQRVEDVLELAAGGGDDADVAAAAGGDPVAELPDAAGRWAGSAPTPPRPSGPAGSPAW